MGLQTELGEDGAFTVGNDGGVELGVTSPTSDRFGGSWIDMPLVRLPYRGAKGQETLAHTVVICLLACVCVYVRGFGSVFVV